MCIQLSLDHRNIEINITQTVTLHSPIYLGQLGYRLYGQRNKNRLYVSSFEIDINRQCLVSQTIFFIKNFAVSHNS